MKSSSPSKDPFFQPFNESIAQYSLPEKFTNPFQYEPHPLCLLAAEQVQEHLCTQTDWEHNFGLELEQEGAVIGKMFGVLVVRNTQNEIGYLAAFSGKLAGGYHHPRFVPPVFDALAEDSFLNDGMRALTHINQKIKTLEASNKDHTAYIGSLKLLRKKNSVALQNKLFDEYSFLNQTGNEKNLRTLFSSYSNTHPPAGAGECAAPKLLQYAFQHNMQPLAIAEFWWGLSPKSDYWKHVHFYPACQQKCAPILSHMLEGLVMDEK